LKLALLDLFFIAVGMSMDLGILAHAGWFMILRSSLLPVSVVSYQRRDLFSRILRNLSLPDN
jgi:hypothetical protein